MSSGCCDVRRRIPPSYAFAIALLVFATLQIPSVRAEGIAFPKDAGVLNVRDFGAKGDGRADDTRAIQDALANHPNEGRIVYLPNGTYLISGTLRWPSAAGDSRGTILQGQNRDKTIVRLKDSCTGYADANAPKAMIWTGTVPAQRFRNAVRDLTIDAGKDNAGAIGLQFMANHQGCVRDVTIRSSDGKGRIGLDLTYAHEIGPLLVKTVRVSGFEFGIRTAHELNSITFEHITLEKQARFGFVNEGQCVTVRDLTSRNTGPAVIHAEGNGILTLVDASLTGISGLSKPAVLSDAPLFARNVTTSGYRESIRNRTGDHQPPGKKFKLFVSQPVQSLFPSPNRSLELPVKETPDVPWDDPWAWVSPTRFGAKADDERDDSRAIQAAIDSGATTIYFPCGSFRIHETVLLRKSVRRIIGCEAQLELADLKGKPGFQVVDGTTPVVIVERISGGRDASPTFDNASKRTLVIKDCDNVSGHFTGPGDVFLEDVSSNSASDWQFGRQNVWARQLNVQDEGTHIRNVGGTVWILGLKTERGGTLMETTDGGRTEVLGGLCHTTTGGKTAPMFVSKDSSISIVLSEVCSTGDPYLTLVQETRGGATKTLKRAGGPERAGGSLIPLFVGFSR